MALLCGYPLRAARVVCLALVAAVLLPVAAGIAQDQRHDRQAELPDQQPLVERALAAVKPSDGGGRVRRLYFVGFAAFGHQAVFKREVEEVRKLFDERFGTRERSLAFSLRGSPFVFFSSVPSSRRSGCVRLSLPRS